MRIRHGFGFTSAPSRRQPQMERPTFKQGIYPGWQDHMAQELHHVIKHVLVQNSPNCYDAFLGLCIIYQTRKVLYGMSMDKNAEIRRKRVCWAFKFSVTFRFLSSRAMLTRRKQGQQ